MVTVVALTLLDGYSLGRYTLDGSPSNINYALDGLHFRQDLTLVDAISTVTILTVTLLTPSLSTVTHLTVTPSTLLS